jgi:hypothetical protein
VLTGGTKRLLAVVADRCHSISVRGAFSAEVLERVGELHGIIASLLAGTPGVLVTHDTRTTEMARLAGIQVLEEARISGSTDFDFQALYDAIDYDEFNRSPVQYYRSFIRYFDDNLVDHQLCRNI